MFVVFSPVVISLICFVFMHIVLFYFVFFCLNLFFLSGRPVGLEVFKNTGIEY